MKLIIDTSEFFIALTGIGITKKIIFSDFIELYAPEYLKEEIEKHKPRIKKLSGLSLDELDKLIKILESRIKFIPREKFAIFLSKANELISDPNDTEYLALAISMNLPIWSNDKHFKEQLIVKIFTTNELVEYLKSLGSYNYFLLKYYLNFFCSFYPLFYYH